MWLPLATFLAITTAMAIRHAMWRDEVRAFSVAIHSRSWADLAANLHVEAHPIVWYAILRTGYAFTHSTLVLPVASIGLATVAAFLILRFAPFPLWARLLCVFGAFLSHEYSVVCRNYGIGVLLMMLACILFPARHDRPVRLGAALALLANTSVHAAIASLIFSLLWLMDALQPRFRRELSRPASATAIVIAVGGVALSLISAHPSPDMAYSFSLSHVDTGRVLRAILADPGLSLRGFQAANIAAAGEIPWNLLSLNPELMARLIADIAIASIGWALRKNPACLVAMVLGIVCFEILFRVVYSGSLRHEGMLAFLLISLCWIACGEPSRAALPRRRRSIALGLLPLLATQAIALPVIARRDLVYTASSSRAFADLIKRTPRYREAILAGEPDYMMEPMPYYVGNPVFMARQGAFGYRVYFDRGARRKKTLRLGRLVYVSDSLACATGRPVLLAIGYPKLLTDEAGEAHLAYQGAVFQWDSAERSRLFSRGNLVHSFSMAATDENYSVFEIPSRSTSNCSGQHDTSSASGD